MVKIGKLQLLMSDGTIRTFKSTRARNRFENYVERVIKHIKPVRIKKIRARIK
jgi:hypothetical protein